MSSAEAPREDLVELLDCDDVDHVNKHWLAWFASATGIAELRCAWIGVNSMIFTGEWRGAAAVAKLCRAELADMECRAVARIGPHANVVTFLCCMDFGSTKMIVMERLVPLLHVVTASALSIADLSFLANDAIAGMVHMHRRGFVHADIKVDNLCVRVCGDGSMESVFVDFGGCLPAGDACVVRTRDYAPPACFRPREDGHIEYAPHTPSAFEDDMWCLAILIMMLLAHRQFTTLDIMRDRSGAMREMGVAFHERFGDD
jgi:serine/threonine protein kinase